MESRRMGVVISPLTVAMLSTPTLAMAKSRGKSLPVEEATLTFAPAVPPPITRKHPAIVHATLEGGMIGARHRGSWHRPDLVLPCDR